jgi:DNA-binding NarL/FixJ family response regulator
MHNHEKAPKVCLVDDDEDFHELLRELGEAGDFRIVDTFTKCEPALQKIPYSVPDIVLMDIRLPDLSGIECTKRLRTLLPEINIIIITGYPDGTTFFRSLMAGAKGFLAKPIYASELNDAIRHVFNGGVILAKAVAPFVAGFVHQFRHINREEELTEREEEILCCVFRGLRDKEIAAALGIGTATVHTHMHRLFVKMKVHSRSEIIAKFLAVN